MLAGVIEKTRPMAIVMIRVREIVNKSGDTLNGKKIDMTSATK